MDARKEREAFRGAMSEVFRPQWRKTTFALLVVVTFLVFIWIPVELTLGNNFFFLKYNWQITIAATALVLLAIWFAGRNIADGCRSCGIEGQCS